jgi:hypothetical protein
MAQIIDCAGAHRTGNLEKYEAGSRIYVSLSRPFKCDQERRDLEHAEQKDPGM